MAEGARAARTLTEVLLAPVAVADPAMGQAAATIPATLAALAVPRPGNGPFRLTDHDVRLALAPPVRPAAAAAPFTWSARTAQRGLGLAAVRALLSGEVRTPTEGVNMAIARASAVHEGQRPASTMDRWLAGLPVPGRAAVSADAVTWATRLWSALDWTAFEAAPAIGRDHWWDSPHSSLLALRGRAEVRAVTTATGGHRVSVHLVVLGGPRRPTVRAELSVVALVEALRRNEPQVPGRIVGWWPDSGHLVNLEVDQSTLEAGMTAVARALAAAGAVPEPGRSETRAAA